MPDKIDKALATMRRLGAKASTTPFLADAPAAWAYDNPLWALTNMAHQSQRNKIMPPVEQADLLEAVAVVLREWRAS